MELRDLRYFATVAEHLHLGRAAETLDLSATALAKSVRRLEKSVGAKLLQRAAKGVALTAVGRALLTRIGPLQGLVNDVRHEAEDLARGYAGHVALGVSRGGLGNLAANACLSLSRTASAVSFRIVTGTNPELSNRLHKGELDLCLTGARAFITPEFVREHLYTDPFVIFASASHRLAGRKQIPLAELAKEYWIPGDTTTRQWHALLGLLANNNLPPPKVIFDADYGVARTSIIAYSNHLGMTTRETLRWHARSLPLVELPLRERFVVRDVSIFYRKGAYLSPAAQRLIEILKTQAKDMPGDRRKTSNPATK